MGEFNLIRTWFSRLTEGRAESLGLLDDAAVLDIPAGKQLVISSDTMNAGTHFLSDADPADIARKSLGAALSDLAAMAADPFCYQLSIAFPEPPVEPWIEGFVEALQAENKRYNIFCSGGDTTSIAGPALSISLSVMGLVPGGQALTRAGAKPGDALVLTGPVGDAWVGLQVLREVIAVRDAAPFIKAYNRPQPRFAAVNAMRKYARAAIDISDGLVADLGHICTASKCGAIVEMALAPYSHEAHEVIDTGLADAQMLLTGGDDYELLLACAPQDLEALLEGLKSAGLNPAVIGRFDDGRGVRVLDAQGAEIHLERSGWRHF